MTDSTLTPVGATVTDADGCGYRFSERWLEADPDSPCRTRTVAYLTGAMLTALWRMQQERDQLQARVAELEKELQRERGSQRVAWVPR